MTFVREKILKDIGNNIAVRLMQEYAFSTKVIKQSTGGFKLDYEILASMYFEHLVLLKEIGMYTWNPAHLCCWDFTFTGHRTFRRSSYSRVGR